jgi:hypothetical protein
MDVLHVRQEPGIIDSGDGSCTLFSGHGATSNVGQSLACSASVDRCQETVSVKKQRAWRPNHSARIKNFKKSKINKNRVGWAGWCWSGGWAAKLFLRALRLLVLLQGIGLGVCPRSPLAQLTVVN